MVDNEGNLLRTLKGPTVKRKCWCKINDKLNKINVVFQKVWIPTAETEDKNQIKSEFITRKNTKRCRQWRRGADWQE